MKKIVVSLCTALVIIVAAVIFKNSYSCNIPIGNRGINNALSFAPLNALFVGSSSFRSNLDIDILDEKYEDKAYILSYGGNQYAACDIQYDELRDRFEHTRGSEALKTSRDLDTLGTSDALDNSDDVSYAELVIFEMDPLMLTEEVKLSDSRVIWDLSLKGKRRLWNKMCKSEGTDTSFKVWYEYFVTSGMDDLVTYPVTEPFYSTRYHKGAKTGEVVSPGKEYLDNEKFDISDSQIVQAQELAVLSIIEKCRRDNQEFIFLETPHYVRLANDETYLKYKEYFLDFLSDVGARCITCEDTGFDNTNPEYFEDMGHMTNLGRAEYTKLLVDIL